MKIFRPIWAEIDCDKVEKNLKQVRCAVGEKVKIIGVVKADAYGHGAIPVSRCLLHAGAECLAVASLEEAVELREAGIKADILALGYTQPGWASQAVEHDIIQTVYHLGLAHALSKEAVRQKKTARAHIKIDTGMGRVGLQAERAAIFVREVASLENLQVEGIYTHLSCADDADDETTPSQLEKFNSLLDDLLNCNIKIPIRHAANSAAAIRYPESRYDAVRPGIVLYGLVPSISVKEEFSQFKPIMTIKSTVVEIKTIPAGARVSYSGAFAAKKPTRVATIPAGYADGFSRALSNRGTVLVNGHSAPIIGNICMDFMMADVTNAPRVSVGDDVVLVGRQGNLEITIDDLASIMNTINYEVVSLIGKRVHRVYVNYHAGNPNEV